MFSLSEVLSHEHARCVQAWEKGAPKAQSVHQARTSWASMLRTLEPVENPWRTRTRCIARPLRWGCIWTSLRSRASMVRCLRRQSPAADGLGAGGQVQVRERAPRQQQTALFG